MDTALQRVSLMTCQFYCNYQFPSARVKLKVIRCSVQAVSRGTNRGERVSTLPCLLLRQKTSKLQIISQQISVCSSVTPGLGWGGLATLNSNIWSTCVLSWNWKYFIWKYILIFEDIEMNIQHIVIYYFPSPSLLCCKIWWVRGEII